MPGYRFALFAGEYVYNQELDEAWWGTVYNQKQLLIITNRSLISDNWPLLPENHSEYNKDGAIMGDSTTDWLIFRTDTSYGRMKTIYQNMQNSRVIKFPEYDSHEYGQDWILVSSISSRQMYGLGSMSKGSGKKMCLFEIQRYDLTDVSDFKK